MFKNEIRISHDRRLRRECVEEELCCATTRTVRYDVAADDLDVPPYVDDSA